MLWWHFGFILLVSYFLCCLFCINYFPRKCDKHALTNSSRIHLQQRTWRPRGRTITNKPQITRGTPPKANSSPGIFVSGVSSISIESPEKSPNIARSNIEGGQQSHATEQPIHRLLNAVSWFCFYLDFFDYCCSLFVLLIGLSLLSNLHVEF